MRNQHNNWHQGSFSKTKNGIQAFYAVVNRHGGGSLPPFDSCNVGLLVGDKLATVEQNRKTIEKKLGLSALCFARQVHGTNVISISEKTAKNCTVDLGIEKGCDSLVTNLQNTGLAVQHADCQAILLHDPQHTAIAAIHSGWRGSVQNIIAATIKKMAQEYGTQSATLSAFIGPSLGQCCAEFINYKKELPEVFYPYKNEQNHFNFHAISQMQLVEAGVKKENIESLDICTSCSADYFSYRRACRNGGKQTGRNCTVIYLKKEEVKDAHITY